MIERDEYIEKLKEIQKRTFRSWGDIAKDIGISWLCLQRFLSTDNRKSCLYRTLRKVIDFIDRNDLGEKK